MKRLICLLNGHRWHTLTRTCTRCGEVHAGLLILDALAPFLAAGARAAAAHAERYSRPPSVENMPVLSELDQAALDVGRQYPNIRAKLPQRYRDMLDAEDREWSETE